MTDTLSQDEVDALLRGLADGEVAVERQAGAARRRAGGYDLVGEATQSRRAASRRSTWCASASCAGWQGSLGARARRRRRGRAQGDASSTTSSTVRNRISPGTCRRSSRWRRSAAQALVVRAADARPTDSSTRCSAGPAACRPTSASASVADRDADASSGSRRASGATSRAGLAPLLAIEVRRSCAPRPIRCCSRSAAPTDPGDRLRDRVRSRRRPGRARPSAIPFAMLEPARGKLGERKAVRAAGRPRVARRAARRDRADRGDAVASSSAGSSCRRARCSRCARATSSTSRRAPTTRSPVRRGHAAHDRRPGGQPRQQRRPRPRDGGLTGDEPWRTTDRWWLQPRRATTTAEPRAACSTCRSAVSVELGRVRMPVRQLLALTAGSVIELAQARRRAARRADQRPPGRARRGRDGEREVRRAPHRDRQPERAGRAPAMIPRRPRATPEIAWPRDRRRRAAHGRPPSSTGGSAAAASPAGGEPDQLVATRSLGGKRSVAHRRGRARALPARPDRRAHRLPRRASRRSAERRRRGGRSAPGRCRARGHASVAATPIADRSLARRAGRRARRCRWRAVGRAATGPACRSRSAATADGSRTEPAAHAAVHAAVVRAGDHDRRHGVRAHRDRARRSCARRSARSRCRPTR